MTGYSTPELEPYMVLAQEIIRRVYAEDGPEEINSWLLAQVQRLGGGHDDARLTWPASFDLYEQIMAKRVATAALPESERRVLTWPWETWRRIIDPLDPGLLMVLAGSDGSGKTLYAENLAEHWARRGMNVVFLHFELNRALMLDRRTVRHTGIARRILKEGKLTAQQEAERQRANDTLRAWPGSITYVHSPGWTMEKAMGEVSALVGDDLCDVFIVDYLEKAAPSTRQLKSHGSNVFAREADDVEIVKRTAEQTERPGVLLAQLNKSGKRESFDSLDRTSIRGAGEKTEKANIVVLFHRESNESQIVKVRVDKNTLGPCGSFEQFLEAGRFLVNDVTAEPTDEQWGF